MQRRRFLGEAALLTGALITGAAKAAEAEEFFVQTVLGPVPVSKLGFTLVHEHVMCDFVGAEQTGRHRWEIAAVVSRMLPFLQQYKERGGRTFVDCTPAFIGRDPRVLQRLARETGLNLVTNTGYYGGAGDKFVPKHAYEESADQLATRWLREWEHGIEDTGIRPGFIKTGIDEIKSESDPLSPIDEKLVRAAARASRQTGMAVTCHTGGGAAGFVATQLFIEEKGDPKRFIVAHSDGHGLAINRRVAELGAWVSIDAISRQPLEKHLTLVQAMAEKCADHLLLSHDNGWYWVGQPNGGEVRDFNYILDVFLPAFRKAGATDPLIQKLTVTNPARAFGMRRRA